MEQLLDWMTFDRAGLQSLVTSMLYTDGSESIKYIFLDILGAQYFHSSQRESLSKLSYICLYQNIYHFCCCSNSDCISSLFLTLLHAWHYVCSFVIDLCVAFSPDFFDYVKCILIEYYSSTVGVYPPNRQYNIFPKLSHQYFILPSFYHVLLKNCHGVWIFTSITLATSNIRSGAAFLNWSCGIRLVGAERLIAP